MRQQLAGVETVATLLALECHGVVHIGHVRQQLLGIPVIASTDMAFWSVMPILCNVRRRFLPSAWIQDVDLTYSSGLIPQAS